MFYQILSEMSSNFTEAIASLYNHLDYFGVDNESDEKKYHYNKKHLGISYMYLFTNIHTLNNVHDWVDIYNQNSTIKENTNETNSIELIDKSFEIIINTYNDKINYLPNIYEVSKGKEYLNIFSLLEMQHTRIEINEDLVEELNSVHPKQGFKILLRQENLKNIHKDIKYIIKKYNFTTTDLTNEVLPLLFQDEL